MRRDKVSHDPATIGLCALVWTLGDPPRAERLLALTGLTPEGLRAGAGDPAMLAAVLTFLESHEPDLIACADAIAFTPDDMVRARMELER